MNKNKIGKCITGLLVCIALMFLWIFVCAALTGEREMVEFTLRDKWIFAGFIGVEGLTFAGMIAFLTKLIRMQPKEPKAQKLGERPSVQTVMMIVTAVVLIFAAFTAGVWCEIHWNVTQIAGGVLWIVGIAVPWLCVLASKPLKQAYLGKWSRKNIQENRDRVWSYRENADMAEKTLKKLRLIRNGTDLYAVMLALCGLMNGFGTGVIYKTVGLGGLAFPGLALVLAALSQLRLPRRASDYEPPAEYYLQPEQYPELYTLARKAAATQGYTGKVKLFIVPGCNAAIGSPQRTVMIQVGEILLNVLSQEELYQILLHEFGHCAGQQKTRKERNYMNWMIGGRTDVKLDWLMGWLYAYPIGRYIWEYQLYEYAASVAEEQAADEAVRRFGQPEIAVSELLKLGCHTLYEWEDEASDFENIYSEEKPTNLYCMELKKFRAAMEKRQDAWIELMKKEILSKAATHPTLRMRIEALGVTEWHMLTLNDTEAWQKEREKATQQIEALIQQKYESDYEESRREAYLEPLKIVEDWENRGCPVVAEEYADVVDALRSLGRVSDAMALCDRAMAELPDAAALLAYYMKGCWLLNRFDPAGQALIYHAMENNNNFVNEGLEIIGNFCCITGRQEDLDIYRAKAVELDQRAADTYEQAEGLNPGDKLSEEHLPEEMLEGILTYLQSVDQAQVRKVYLVRKTVSEDFFASAVVLRFNDSAAVSLKEEVFHKMFRYLDTSTDWYFMLYDYDDVRAVNFDKIPGSCVYERTEVTVK